MKIKAIKLDEEALPSEITVKMNIREAAALCALTGKMSPMLWSQILPDLHYEDWEGIYDTLHTLFCRFYENAVDDFTEIWSGARLCIEDENVR